MFGPPSLTNIILRCPGSSSGCSLGEVGLPTRFDPSLTHSLSASSKWILSIVATALVGAITIYVILLVLGSKAYSNGMLSRFTTVFSNTRSSGVHNLYEYLYVWSEWASQFSCYGMEVGHSIHVPGFFLIIRVT